MSSQKEELSPSNFFGNSSDGNPSSQVEQQKIAAQHTAQRTEEVKKTSTAETPIPAVTDASTFFDGFTDDSNVNSHFSSPPATAVPNVSNEPTSQHSTQNASAASFFDQPNLDSASSFFDEIAKAAETPSAQSYQEPTAKSLTQAYDPNTYSQYDYSQQQEGVTDSYEQQQQTGSEQQYEQSPWIQFDPNQHYYYDEQNQVRYYDPNTNQEYDISQYGYDQQGQNYDYQYDPQYAEYYAQQGYDPNSYATETNTVEGNEQHQQSYIPNESSYDPTTYAPVDANSSTDQEYYNPNSTNNAGMITQHQEVQPTQQNYDQYNPQAYAPVSNFVAQVPAQVQSEQTIDTQHYTNEVQDNFGYSNTYDPQQTQDYDYQSYAPTQEAKTDVFGYGATDLQQQQDYGSHRQDYSETQELSQPQSVLSQGPPMNIAHPPPPPRNTEMASSQQQQTVPVSPPSSHRGSFDALVPTTDQPPTEEVNLDDLDDLVLGAGGSGSVHDQNTMLNTTDYNEPTKEFNDFQTELHYLDPNQNKDELNEPITDVKLKQNVENLPTLYHPKREERVNGVVNGVVNDEPRYSEQQQKESIYTSTYMPQQQNATTYEPQEELSEQNNVYEFQPQGGENYNTHDSQQGQYYTDYNQANYTDYEQHNMYSTNVSQQKETTTNYEPQMRDITTYEPQQQKSQNPAQLQSSYEPYNSYEPQQQLETVSENQPVSMFNQPVPPHFTSSPPQADPAMIRRVTSPQTTMFRHPSNKSSNATEPDRRNASSPFTGQYNNQHPIERSATVPPPITERIASPKPILTPCPDPTCEGENKTKAKFCCECGRPLAGISRSTTPSVNISSQIGIESYRFNNIHEAMPVRTALDDKRDALIESLKKFNNVSVLINSQRSDEEKQSAIATYIDSRTGEFEQSKALLWNVVKLMIQHKDDESGSSELDKAIASLITTGSDSQIDETDTNNISKIEKLLSHGKRDEACQVATENDMWAHALIISNSLQEKELFQRVISQFISRELFSSTDGLTPQIPSEKKSLRMLYSVFGGAGLGAIAEFVKTSAEDQPASPYSTEALKGWNDALALILFNRSLGDQKAIVGLGDELRQLDLLPDAYLCYILSPNLFMQSSLDDVSYKLVKTDRTDDLTDLDALYLTELYDYALLSDDPSKSIHQDYKLIYAWWLSELGFANEAEIYCDSVAKTVTGTTTVSTSNAIQELKKVGNLCSTVNSSGMTLLNKSTFNTLIGSIEEKIGSSQSYSYGHQDGFNAFGSKELNGYGQTSDQFGQESLADSTLHYNHNYEEGYTNNSYQPTAAPAVAMTSPFGAANRPIGGIKSPFQQSTTTSHVQTPFNNTDYTPQLTSNDNTGTGGWWGAEGQTNTEPIDTYTPAAATPATHAGYDDDDDDLGFGNSSKKKATSDHKNNNEVKAEKPNEVDPTEKRDSKQEKKGWSLLSLFGRKEGDQSTDEKKAVKANLGEQSSFYYDEEKKRWVNKTMDTEPVAQTPPPPPKMQPPPTMGSPMSPPSGGLKPNSMPPMRTTSAPNAAFGAETPGTATPPVFNTPPLTSRSKGGKKGSKKPRYVDVLNAGN